MTTPRPAASAVRTHARVSGLTPVESAVWPSGWTEVHRVPFTDGMGVLLTRAGTGSPGIRYEACFLDEQAAALPVIPPGHRGVVFSSGETESVLDLLDRTAAQVAATVIPAREARQRSALPATLGIVDPTEQGLLGTLAVLTRGDVPDPEGMQMLLALGAHADAVAEIDRYAQTWALEHSVRSASAMVFARQVGHDTDACQQRVANQVEASCGICAMLRSRTPQPDVTQRWVEDGLWDLAADTPRDGFADRAEFYLRKQETAMAQIELGIGFWDVFAAAEDDTLTLGEAWERILGPQWRLVGQINSVGKGQTIMLMRDDFTSRVKYAAAILTRAADWDEGTPTARCRALSSHEFNVTVATDLRPILFNIGRRYQGQPKIATVQAEVERLLTGTPARRVVGLPAAYVQQSAADGDQVGGAWRRLLRRRRA